MTALGMALQGLVIVTAIMALCLIVWPRLPLLTEWPVQWLALAEGLDHAVVKEAVKGGVTASSVESSAVVFLSLSHGGSNEVRLTGVRS